MLQFFYFFLRLPIYVIGNVINPTPHPSALCQPQVQVKIEGILASNKQYLGNTSIKGEVESSRRFQRIPGGLKLKPLEGLKREGRKERQVGKEDKRVDKKEGKK